MRILVSGARGWANAPLIEQNLVFYAGQDKNGSTGLPVLIHGACPKGADKLANDIAEKLGWEIERYPADWDRLGKKAGVLRNEDMVDTRPDLVLAFPLPEGTGTQHCIGYAVKKGCHVVVVDPNGNTTSYNDDITLF